MMRKSKKVKSMESFRFSGQTGVTAGARAHRRRARITVSLVCHTCQPDIAFLRVAWPPRAVAYGVSSPTVREYTTSHWR
jgi:hypothetical protein